MADLRSLPNLPRGLRNNNPGNLRLTNIAWQGKVPNAQNTDGDFEQFVSLQYGIRAMAKDIANDINKGKNTIEKLVYEYAPPNENNTENYINIVSQRTGIPRTAPITAGADTLRKLIAAKVVVENGAVAQQYITPQIIDEALVMAKIMDAVKTGGAITGILLLIGVAYILSTSN